MEGEDLDHHFEQQGVEEEELVLSLEDPYLEVVVCYHLEKDWLMEEEGEPDSAQEQPVFDEVSCASAVVLVPGHLLDWEVH